MTFYLRKRTCVQIRIGPQPLFSAAQGVKNSSADPNTISQTFRSASNAELDLSRLYIRLIIIPFLQWQPVNPAVHKQRYPLPVKPVWQVALFLQEFFKHAFLDKEKKETLVQRDLLIAGPFRLHVKNSLWTAIKSVNMLFYEFLFRD